jgi:hypothetical protein
VSKLSEEARAAAKSKAERLVRSDPRERCDASGYSPDGAMDADVQTGERPISRRQFRTGGKVAGEAVGARADRKPRANGGRTLTADSLINRDVRAANEERPGIKHVGGFKKGGRAHKTMGGLALPNWADAVARKSGGRTGKLMGGAMSPQARIGLQQPPQAAGAPPMSRGAMARPMMRKDGGKVHAAGCECAKCGGGRVGRKDGGKLTTKSRDAIKTKNFAGPDRSYPIENESHARNALARASGKPVEAQVRAKVHAKYPGIGKASGGAINDGTRPVAGRLARKGGGRTKKGTNVNIIITQPPAKPPMPMPPMGGPPPVGMGQGMPPAGTAPMPPPGAGGVPPGAPMMPRATGGRAYPIDAGAGGGLGRLEKAERAARR